MLNLKQLKDVDPLDRRANKQTEQAEFSPMAPPDAYAPPGLEAVPYEEMHPFLQQLMDEHNACVDRLDTFEEALVRIREDGIRPEHNRAMSTFFRYLDDQLVRHYEKEEKVLFPALHERLIEEGEHSQGPVPTTAVDMLEDDHRRSMQLAAVTFNFFGLAGRLPDPDSRAMVLDAALEQGKALVELLRLHIFREDTTVFSLAQRHLTLDDMDSGTAGARKGEHLS